jgi:hypothetical protein
MSKDKDTFKTLLGQLRQIYDGRINKSFGNGSDDQVIKVHVSWLGACTSEWYSIAQQHASMGERFFTYEMTTANQERVANLIRNRTSNAFRDKLHFIYKEYLEYVLPKESIDQQPIEDSINDEIFQLCDMATLSRTAVGRNRYAKNEVTNVHLREAIGRLYNSSMVLCKSLRHINLMDGIGNINTESDMRLIARFILTSIPQARRNMLFSLAKYGGSATFKTIRDTGTANEEALQDLAHIGVIHKSQIGYNGSWMLPSKYVELLNKWRPVMSDTLTTYEDSGNEDWSMPISPATPVNQL